MIKNGCPPPLLAYNPVVAITTYAGKFKEVGNGPPLAFLPIGPS